MVGRPTKYKPEYAELAYRLALLNHTDEEMAGVFGVEPSTFYLWKQKHPAFSEAVTRGKVPADGAVVVSFHKKACGYEYESEKIFYDKDAAHPDERIVRVRTTVHVPPDAGAALNWLKNRQPDKWRDKRIEEIELRDSEAFPVIRLTTSGGSSGNDGRA